MSILTRSSDAMHNATHPSDETAHAVTKTVGIFGLIVLGVAVVTTIALLPDIARYIRMKSL